MPSSKRIRPSAALSIFAILFPAVSAFPAAGAADGTVGWRGNWTGLWPDARPPLEWSRTPIGPSEGLATSARKPGGPGAPGEPLAQGLVRTWLVLGPFPAGDPARPLDASTIPDEKDPRPDEGVTAGDRAWRTLATAVHDRFEFGSAELEWTDPAKAFPVRPGESALLHVWLRAARAGILRAVVDHAGAMAAWVDGKEVYRSPRREIGLGGYQGLSYCLQRLESPRSPSFDLPLAAGWSRLCLKLVALPGDPPEMKFSLRIGEPPSTSYEARNILWMAELPDTSNATPVIAGGRAIVMAEPDEVLAVDGRDGRILWSAAVSLWEAEPPADPAVREKLEPLTRELAAEKSRDRRLEIRRKIRDLLEGADRERYAPKLDGHLAGHLGIVGFTTPTPACDGRSAFVWCGNGVAAAFDLDGRRRWIRRVAAGKLYYPSSPALIDGRVVVFMKGLHALDGATGEVLWRQPEIDRNNGAVIPARLAGTAVVVGQMGDIVRAADGRILWRNPSKSEGDTGWCPPVVIGDSIFQPMYGVSRIDRIDCSGSSGDDWSPKVATIDGISVNRKPDGSWLDRFTPASPLVHDGIAYGIDIYATFYAVDLREGKVLYRQDLDLDGMFHYNAVPVAASPALIGGKILVMDNQGTAIILEPGREFRRVGRNRIGTQLERAVPVSPQETISYGAPVPDGDRLYIRGERHLYCIGRR